MELQQVVICFVFLYYDLSCLWISSDGSNEIVADVFQASDWGISLVYSKKFPGKELGMGDEEGVVEFKSPDSHLAAYPTEAGVSVMEGSGSRGTCGRREVGLYRGVTNSGPGTGTLGMCSGNGELVFFQLFRLF